MRSALAIGLVTLAIALTARGDQLNLSQPVINALTPLDDNPSADVLDPVFVTSGGTETNLAAIAVNTDGAYVNEQLHAIRSLPLYCPTGSPQPPCGVETVPDTVVHSTLTQLIDAFALIPSPTPQDLLRLRAAIEALGIAGFSAGLASDVTRLVVYLGHPSRDVRATTARALGSLCNTQAILPLRTQLQGEHIDQVKLAISAALRDLGQCPGG